MSAGNKRAEPTSENRRKHNYRKMAYMEGIKPQDGFSETKTYRWEHLLEGFRASADANDEEELVLPVALFGNPPLGNFMKVMHTGLKLEIRHYDYKEMFPDKEIYWVANVNKIVGYRFLMRYEGMDQEGDEKHDFWINIGSEELKHVGFCSANDGCELLPPVVCRKRQQDWATFIVQKLHSCKTLTPTWVDERKYSLLEGRFKEGVRLELLDRQFSNHIRPARVIKQLGRRICVRVSAQDVDDDDLGDDAAQTKTGVWCDESWELIFPVGWALKNGWELVAKQEYKEHCMQIVKALEEGREPEYTPFDASPEIFHDWKENSSDSDELVHWKVGMKFECLDPLNQSFLELKVATCIGLLKDGYLKVGFDGPEMEDEAIPIHCTSPYIFPINYANAYGIKLVGPPDMDNFKWNDYLRQSQAIAAPEILFDKMPSSDMMATQFKIGAKLEATDQCESNLVCPGTVKAVRGRLLQIHFDGWGDDYDQLFDYRSRDLFPLGWCEIYGYKLEIPKGNEPAKKKKKRA